MSTFDSSVRPKYLNWKCIDNLDKVSDEKIFYDGKITLSAKQRHDAKKHFSDLKAKYSKILNEFVEEANGKKKTHLTLAGGSYTFFFVLPSVLSWISRKYPFLGVELQLFERGGPAKLQEQNADIVLTTRSLGGTSLPREDIEQANYSMTRKSTPDVLFLATSKEAISSFGSTDMALKLQDVIFSRLYSTHNTTVETIRWYPTAPAGRGGSPRVVVDQYFLEYMMLRNAVGLGYLVTTMKLGSSIVRLSHDILEEVERFAIIKSTLNGRYKRIYRRCIDAMAHKEVVDASHNI